AHHRVEAGPVAGGLARAAVDDEFVGVLGDLRVEVVHQHPQHRLLLPPEGVQFGSAWGADGAWSGGALLAHTSSPPASEMTDAAAANKEPSSTMECAAAISGAR